VRGDELRTHGMPAMPQDLRRPSHMQGEPADSASGHIRRRRHPRWSMACARLPAPFAERGCIQLGGQTRFRPADTAATAGAAPGRGGRPPDGRVFPCYTVSQVLAPCRPWQRPPPPAG
jgi:hypothetical protein